MKKKTWIFIIAATLVLLVVIILLILNSFFKPVKKTDGSIPYNENNLYTLYNGCFLEFSEDGMVTQYSVVDIKDPSIIKRDFPRINLPVKKYISWNLFITEDDEIMFGDIIENEHKKLGTVKNAANIRTRRDREGTLLRTAVITTDGLLFVQGDNSTGALGIEEKQINDGFVHVPNLQNVVDAVFGIDCIFVLNADGEVFLSGTWGELSYKTFTKLEIPEKVKDITGSLISGTLIALGVDGNVYEMGVSYFQNIYYNESTVHTGSFYSTFQKISRLKNIVSVTVHGTTAYAIDNDGKVFYWGSEMKGNSSKLTKVFKRVCGIPKADAVWRGDYLYILNNNEITAYDW